ncbi:hypothetical protein J8G26_03475 [Acidovorax sp. JG5]|uniref:hypothetical protein n=1 Tax=Acidovorax sp. JG5 TaxID=2822718 RepID=UPI001B324BB3|nr:hypothetical protein [Acidovorax sp. JG5]MBP3979794.1 hypothetical protein [Acidovorax sp. JG5]
MKMDVTYHPGQDRLRLCLRNDQQRTDWWLTRRITLRLLHALINQLQKVPLPTLNAPWLPRTNEREIAQEHAMSLEFDAIRADDPGSTAGPGPLEQLVDTATLTVSPTETRLQLAAGKNSAQLTLTRMESHALAEALALMARKGGWLASVDLPPWLGQTTPT